MLTPCTVRQVFYQATVRGVIEKSEAGYSKVQTLLVRMRREGEIPYGWLVDNTRWQRKPELWLASGSDCRSGKVLSQRPVAASRVLRGDRLEKDALSGVLYPVTAEYDVPLMVARGYSSLSFLHSAAEYIAGLDVPAFIYHLGDFDPSGVNAGEKIEQTLHELAPEAEIYFERLAVNPEQIEAWRLPSRPKKQSDSRARRFGHAESVELDAIHPQQLRQLVKHAIRAHLPEHQLRVLREAEASERAFLKMWVQRIEARA